MGKKIPSILVVTSSSTNSFRSYIGKMGRVHTPAWYSGKMEWCCSSSRNSFKNACQYMLYYVAVGVAVVVSIRSFPACCFASSADPLSLSLSLTKSRREERKKRTRNDTRHITDGLLFLGLHFRMQVVLQCRPSRWATSIWEKFKHFIVSLSTGRFLFWPNFTISILILFVVFVGISNCYLCL